jgi:pSer/pThr/pTyr-binding forkhead associated (FHA) protein
MRLIVKQDDSTISEFQFTEGPIYIGRHKNSQIFLGHRAVSRQHAVIFHTEDGKWMVEDLDSANKTYLNGEPVHKTEVKTGDVLRIVDFVIEVSLEEQAKTEKSIDMEDTLTKTAYDLQTSFAAAPSAMLVRQPDEEHAPAMRLPAKRLIDFASATELICAAGDSDSLLLTLLDITLKQFEALHVWCALRKQPNGPMTAHAGKQRDGKKVELAEIIAHDKITQSVENGQYLVLPGNTEAEEQQKVRSAMIAPIMRRPACFGILYVDNAIDAKSYTIGDLDYLMLLSIHTAAVLDKLP